MLKTILNYINTPLRQSLVKKLQEEINSLKSKTNPEASITICKKVYKFSKLKPRGPLDVRSCYLKNSNFDGLKISRICFWNSNLKNSSFKNACLHEADFWKANLRGSNLTNADLTGSVMTQADLTNSVMTGTNLKNVRLEQANLLNADLTNANLKWTKIELYQLKTVKSLQNAIMPDGSEFSSTWKHLINNANPPEHSVEM